MWRVLVIRSNPPTAVVAVGLPDDVLAVMISKSNVYVRRANPPFSRTNVRNTGDITQTSSESPPQKLGRDLECEHGTTVVCDRKRAHRLRRSPEEGRIATQLARRRRRAREAR